MPFYLADYIIILMKEAFYSVLVRPTCKHLKPILDLWRISALPL